MFTSSPPDRGHVYVLRLYVTGGARLSVSAIRNVRRLCDEHLVGRCELTVVDLHQQPALAREAQLVAAPTLVKELPLPSRRFIGTMADTPTILAGIGARELP
jgi:circadian clock protein KaiB